MLYAGINIILLVRNTSSRATLQKLKPSTRWKTPFMYPIIAQPQPRSLHCATWVVDVSKLNINRGRYWSSLRVFGKSWLIWECHGYFSSSPIIHIRPFDSPDSIDSYQPFVSFKLFVTLILLTVRKRKIGRASHRRLNLGISRSSQSNGISICFLTLLLKPSLSEARCALYISVC
jgi:hypothetical protein